MANVPIGGDSKGVVQRTVYMIAEATTEEAPLAPLFAAMAAEIHGTAARIGQASASGRLDPPLLMGLVISSLRRAVFDVLHGLFPVRGWRAGRGYLLLCP